MDVRDLKIDTDNLDMELSEQASKFMYVAELAVNADQDYEKKKAELEVLEASTARVIREDALASKTKITEKSISEIISENSEILKAKSLLIQTKGKRDLLKALREAWSMRKDTLLRLAMSKRDEIDSLGNSTISSVNLKDIV